MALVFAVVHSYNIFLDLIASVLSFFIHFFKSGIDKSTDWSTIPACPNHNLCAFLFFFLTGEISKGPIL